MKMWIIIVLTLAPITSNAVPITYTFNGYISEVKDRNPGHDSPGLHDWWPEVGDGYYGTVIFDEDALIFNKEGSICALAKSEYRFCGGVVYFEMTLGDGYVALQHPPYFIGPGESLDSFDAWAQSVGGYGTGYDSFFFSRGSFSGVDAAYFDGIRGVADNFLRVPEPSTLMLLLFSFTGLGYRRFRQSRNAVQ